jgi:hypothetical protein
MVYGDSLVILSYHPLETDTFVNAESKTRGRWYNYGYEPACIFDGSSPIHVDNSDSFYVRYQDNILGARSQPTSLTIEFDTTITKIDSTQLMIGFSLTPTESLPDPTNLRLFTVIYEDSASYVSNFPPFPTKHSLFVVRKILPDTLGLNLTVNFPNTFDTVFVTRLGNWQPEHIGVASFVQNIATKNVLQAVVKRKL